MTGQKRLWEIMEVANPDDKPSKVFDIFILTLISLSVLAVILETLDTVRQGYSDLFFYFEAFTTTIFTFEYLGRVWSCVTSDRFSHPFRGRIRFVRTPLALIDLIAILPFYLPFLGLDLRFVRMFRLSRIFRIAKAARYISSLSLFGSVFRKRKEELLITTFLMIILLIISSSLMYYFENSAQPDQFTSIPATMWWAVATLTTVGYGDIYPITGIGKVIGSVVAVLGIALFALPTGILGAGFVEELRKIKTESRSCPHCGKSLEDI